MPPCVSRQPPRSLTYTPYQNLSKPWNYILRICRCVYGLRQGYSYGFYQEAWRDTPCHGELKFDKKERSHYRNLTYHYHTTDIRITVEMMYLRRKSRYCGNVYEVANFIKFLFSMGL